MVVFNNYFGDLLCLILMKKVVLFVLIQKNNFKQFDDVFKFADLFIRLFDMNFNKNYCEYNNIIKFNPIKFKYAPIKLKSKHKGLEIFEADELIHFRVRGFKVDDINPKIEELLNLLDNVINHFELFEKQRADFLYKKYLEDKEELKFATKSLTQFINLNRHYVTSDGMCKLFYEYVKLNKNGYISWVRKYKENNRCYFITKSELKRIVEDMKNAIKEQVKI